MTLSNLELSILGTLCLYISYTIGQWHGKRIGVELTMEWLINNDFLRPEKFQKEDDDE